LDGVGEERKGKESDQKGEQNMRNNGGAIQNNDERIRKMVSK